MLKIIARLLSCSITSSYRNRRSPCVEHLETRDCPSTIYWTSNGGGSWNVPSNWSTGTVPTATDDVIFDGGTSGQHNGDCTYTGPNGNTIANSITLDSNYTGTLHAVNGFTVAGLLELDNGHIDQPSGVGQSDITTTSFTWSGGGFNDISGVKGVLNVQGFSNSVITCTNQILGSDLNLLNGTLKVQGRGSLIFGNNAGVNLTSGAVWDWWGGTVISAGMSAITNGGGTFMKDPASTVATLTADMPYINNSNNAMLLVGSGTLDFASQDSTYGVSVVQQSGTIGIGWVPQGQSYNYVGGATLQVDSGLVMFNGVLRTADGYTSYITGMKPSIAVHGGFVEVGFNEPGNLLSPAWKKPRFAAAQAYNTV